MSAIWQAHYGENDGAHGADMITITITKVYLYWLVHWLTAHWTNRFMYGKDSWFVTVLLHQIVTNKSMWKPVCLVSFATDLAHASLWEALTQW